MDSDHSGKEDEASESMLKDGTVEQVDTQETKYPMRLNVFLTLCIGSAFMSLGMCSCIGGPSLVHLEILFDTDTQGISTSFMTGSLGYTIGGVLCSSVYDRLNSEIQFLVATASMGAITILLPWVPTLKVFLVAVIAHGISMGFLDGAAQSYILSLWIKHKWKNPLMNALHGVWSLGATLAPFITSFFLVDLHRGRPEDTTLPPYTTSSFHDLDNQSLPYSDTNRTDPEATVAPDVTLVRYGYLVVGLTCVVPVAMFAVGFQATGASCRRQASSKSKEDEKSKEQTYFKVVMLMLLFCTFAAFVWYEVLPGMFLTSLAYKGLGWDEQKSARLTSAFFAAHGTARFISVPASTVLRPTTMVVINIFVVTSGYILMAFAEILPDMAMWVSTCLVGLGIGSTFASTFLWASQHITITGRAAGVLLVGGCMGGTFAGPVTGYMFQTYSYMWVVYMCLLACAGHVALFAAMNIVVFCFEKRVGTKDDEETAGSLEMKVMCNDNSGGIT